jgi:hypothetical protein
MFTVLPAIPPSARRKMLVAGTNVKFLVATESTVTSTLSRFKTLPTGTGSVNSIFNSTLWT